MLKKHINKYNIIIFLLSFILYANTIGHDYAWDDSIVITENPRVQKGLSGIPELFLKYNSDYKADKYGYRPITLTSFAIEYGIFGNTPAIGHLMNVIYFGILCMVMFTVLKKIFHQFTLLAPFIITILFIAHPLHTEVVANIKSRDEIFAMLFAFLALNSFINFHTSNKSKHLIFAFILFILAFLSKESAAVFLAIIPLTGIYLFSFNNLKKYITSISLIIILFIISFAIFYTYTKSQLGIETSKGAGIYYESGILGNSFFYIDVLSTKIANAFTLLFMYLKNFIYPLDLVYFYGYNQIPVSNWQQPLVIVSALFHLGLLVFALLRWKKSKEISFGILFYFISISIYLQIFRTIADTMADRFMFVPSLGLIIIIVFALAKLLKIDLTKNGLDDILKLNTSNPSITKLKYISLICFCILSAITFSRNSVWKNNETLIKHDLPSLDNCSRAHSYYADILKTKLKTSFDLNTESEMINHYKKSISITKEAYYAYLGLSTYFIETNKLEEAINLLDSMLIKYPNQADPNYYIGTAYYKKADYAKSLNYLQTSLKLAPDVANTYFYLALCFSKNNEFNKAIETINQSKNKFGETASYYEVLGNIYFDKGDMDQSTKYTFETLKYGADPNLVYSIVIGRYQSKKMDAQANFYYKQGIQRGVFKK